ncbi:Mitochondrial intermembrane space import and assembly protein 40 [Frankliniella fusca]|uniref:Mitochondrial intermembrane space import and assembly protein 40 n=1 Tax=Frankliniella fusca TaxID=407009 RepID=A0AAE1GRK9_9NEOP|nr:Mitochondrial intermembrane space import and assembly protein 40 [Frankliniella fusca]
MSKYFYLDVSFNFVDSKEQEVDAISFKNYICTAVRTLFGDFGASIIIDLLKFDKETQRGIIRCPAQEYVKVRGSLTFCGQPTAAPFNTADNLQSLTMSVCKKEGKDIIIIAAKEDHDIPSKIELPELEPQPGGMATGPCGVEFREAFQCFHYSSADPKGSDCVELFKEMQGCMSQYPALYDNRDGKDEEYEDGMGDNLEMNVEKASAAGHQENKPSSETSSSDSKEKA